MRVDDRLERVQAMQRADGTIVVAAESEAGVEHVRFVLGLDDDHSEFLRRFADDPLLGETLRRLRGLRPMRTGTVAQALLRAVAGQLIQASRARQIERTIIRAATPELDGLHAPPTSADLGRFSPAELGRLGLGARRAACLVRLCRSLDLERLKQQPTDAVARTARRASAASGRGRSASSASKGSAATSTAWRAISASRSSPRRSGAGGSRPRRADVLLEPYGEWAGLASVYLLAGFAVVSYPCPMSPAA